jgi:hypothetical protein
LQFDLVGIARRYRHGRALHFVTEDHEGAFRRTVAFEDGAMIEGRAFEQRAKARRERKAGRHQTAGEHRGVVAIGIVQEGGDLARHALRAARRTGRQTAGRAHQPLDEIKVEGHQLGGGITVVRLVVGRIGMEIGAQPPSRDAQQPSVLARSGDSLDVFVSGERAHQQADLQQAVRAARGVAHLLGLVQSKRQWGLTEYMLARVKRRHHESTVNGAGQADVDGIHARISDQGGGVAERLGLADRGSRSGACRVTREHADDGRFWNAGIGCGVRGSHGAGAQDADPDRGQSSHPASLTCSRKVLLTGTRSPLRSARTLRPALRSTDAIAPSATHHERWT